MATIYVVIGTTGEWADSSTWNVCYRTTKEEADKICDLCQAQADEYLAWMKKRPAKSFLKRHSWLENYSWQEEDRARRAMMFDKWFSHDFTGTAYSVRSLSEDPAADPDFFQYLAMRKQWEDDQRAEQLKHCTVDDRSPIAKLGDLIKSKLR